MASFCLGIGPSSAARASLLSGVRAWSWPMMAATTLSMNSEPNSMGAKSTTRSLEAFATRRSPTRAKRSAVLERPSAKRASRGARWPGRRSAPGRWRRGEAVLPAPDRRRRESATRTTPCLPKPNGCWHQAVPRSAGRQRVRVGRVPPGAEPGRVGPSRFAAARFPAMTSLLRSLGVLGARGRRARNEKPVPFAGWPSERDDARLDPLPCWQEAGVGQPPRGD
jgi:hypothetical protein